MFKDQVVGKFVGGFFGAVGAALGAVVFEMVRKEMKKAEEAKALADKTSKAAAAKIETPAAV